MPLARAALGLLSSQPRHSGDCVFPGVRTGKGIEIGAFHKRTLDARILEREGKSLAAWVWHDFRRAASTWMNKNGVAPHVVEAILGHHTGGIAGVYNLAEHADAKRRALERWADFIAGQPVGSVVTLRRGVTALIVFSHGCAMADDSDKAIRRLRIVLAAFAPPGLPSPGFLRRAAEVEQTLQWCEQRPNDPFATEIFRGLSTEAGLKPASPSPNPPTVPLPPADWSNPLPAADLPPAGPSPPIDPLSTVVPPPADPPNSAAANCRFTVAPACRSAAARIGSALDASPQCPQLITPPPPPAPTRRDRAKRKQAAVQDIAHRAFPPKGEVPPNISTARFSARPR